MQQLTVNIFEDTTSINIPKGTAYVEIVTYKGTPYYYFENIEDSMMFKILSNPTCNTIVLDRENFSADMFPLTITTFDDDDLINGTELFNKSRGIPYSSIHIAVGKRNTPSKNITFGDLYNYINEGGSAYMTKDFSGLDYDEARENLGVYSKKEIDSFQNEYMFSNVIFDLRKQDALRVADTYPLYPFRESKLFEGVRLNSHNTFRGWYKGGVCGLEINFLNVKSYMDNGNNPFRFSGIQELFNGRQFTTQVPLVIVPTVTRNSSQSERPAYLRRGYRYSYIYTYDGSFTQELTDPIANDVSQYPVMVITPDYDIHFANYMLTANSVYFVDLKWRLIPGGTGETMVAPMGISWYADNSGNDWVKYDFNYKVTFMPNDPQLN